MNFYSGKSYGDPKSGMPWGRAQTMCTVFQTGLPTGMLTCFLVLSQHRQKNKMNELQLPIVVEQGPTQNPSCQISHFTPPSIHLVCGMASNSQAVSARRKSNVTHFFFLIAGDTAVTKIKIS